MNKLCLALLLATTGVFAQQNTTEVTTNNVLQKKHELKLGAIKLLSGPILDITYERIHSEDFTYGLSLLGNLDQGNDYGENFSVTPFARMYFSEPRHYGARGFFVEGFGKFLTGKNNVQIEYTVTNSDGYTYTQYSDENRSFSAASLGISLGWKWINHSGFVFEILMGAGRNLGGNTATPDANFRGDFNLGYRF